eukprot:GILJ01012462.1.p1 GENE.GILJ01012462.1~~GILJ01012462.1.p1  ORF type:complete len:253 (+),score=44.30 GILJ01012462.1:497-1255(+)
MSRLLQTSSSLKDTDFVKDIHCMHPVFLEDQLNRSLSNLQVDAVDLLYLHNAAESQLPLIGEDTFKQRLKDAFTFFESARSRGKIKYYGLATWTCFRSPQDEDLIHVELEKVVQLAESIGGANHGFRFIQVPISIAMPEAFVESWQTVNGQAMNLLEAASALDVSVFASSPLFQGRLLQTLLPKSLGGVTGRSARHLQLVRSLPYKSLIAPLVGHKQPEHVKANLEVAYHAPMSEKEFESKIILGEANNELC